MVNVENLKIWEISCQKLLMLLFQRSQVSFPAPTCQVTTAFNSSSRRSNAIFWPLKTAHIQQCTEVHTSKTHIHIESNQIKYEIKNNKTFKKITLM